jgi:CRP-like cAMP-binding protein
VWRRGDGVIFEGQPPMVRHENALTRNRLLAALPADEAARLLPDLSEISLELHRKLELPNTPATHVYFPWGGVCSLTTAMRDGRLVEVGTIGNEGMVGMSAYFGDLLPQALTVVQVAGPGAHSMRAGLFKAEMTRQGPLFDLIRRYSQALIGLIMQSAACNGLHSVDQRCARWLLMSQDRVGDVIALTQEYLASMLGVRRSSVTEVANRLQAQGLIKYARGRITILDRAGLEALSCECYPVVKASFDRLVP